jgi:hypothetical protein
MFAPPLPLQLSLIFTAKWAKWRKQQSSTGKL